MRWFVSDLLSSKYPVKKPQLIVVHVSQTDPCCLCQHYQTLCSESQSDCATLSSPNKPQDVALPDRGVSCVPAEWSSSRHWPVGGCCPGCPPHTDRRENLCSRVNSPLPDHTQMDNTLHYTHHCSERSRRGVSLSLCYFMYNTYNKQNDSTTKVSVLDRDLMKNKIDNKDTWGTATRGKLND